MLHIVEIARSLAVITATSSPACRLVSLGHRQNLRSCIILLRRFFRQLQKTYEHAGGACCGRKAGGRGAAGLHASLQPPGSYQVRVCKLRMFVVLPATCTATGAAAPTAARTGALLAFALSPVCPPPVRVFNNCYSCSKLLWQDGSTRPFSSAIVAAAGRQARAGCHPARRRAACRQVGPAN